MSSPWWPWNWGSGIIEDPIHPHASRFVVLLDDRIRLAESTDVMVESTKYRQFNYPLYDVFGSPYEPVILHFTLENSDHLDLQVQLNNLYTGLTLPTGPQRSVDLVLGGRYALPARNGANQLKLEVRKGSCTIYSIVIWHQVTSEG
jgi:hypothetical protein